MNGAWSRARRRALQGVALAALGTAAWLVAPALLRHVAFFRVRQIELVGVRNLAPEVVLAALRLPAGASVFSDTRLLADRVRGVPGGHYPSTPLGSGSICRSPRARTPGSSGCWR